MHNDVQKNLNRYKLTKCDSIDLALYLYRRPQTFKDINSLFSVSLDNNVFIILLVFLKKKKKAFQFPA